MANPNLGLLIAIAQAMGPLCEYVVFVGGCATGLLVDDANQMDVRPTEDVDAIVEVASLAAYHRLADGLMDRGFKQTMADNTPPFRWFWNRMQLDLVPLDEKVLGFANPWYKPGFDAALNATLPSGLQLRHLSAQLCRPQFSGRIEAPRFHQRAAWHRVAKRPDWPRAAAVLKNCRAIRIP